MMQNNRLQFIVQWLLHAVIVWFVVNLSSAINYWYSVKTMGPFLIKPDGNYVTQWDRFLSRNYYNDTNLLILMISLIAEGGFHYVFLKKKTLPFMLYCTLAALLFSVYMAIFKTPPHSSLSLQSYATVFSFVFAYVFLYAVIRDFFYRRVRQAKQLSARQEAELNQLKAQVNPHFFFNTLNSIYGLSLEEKANRTSQCVEKLADMMRFTMSSSSKKLVAVEEELNFIRNYIHLQQIRIGDSSDIVIKTNISSDDTKLLVAPVLLIPFIENAFQYGVSMDTKSFVTIDIEVVDGQLSMAVSNSLHLPQPVHGHGTGIANTKRRLELLYPGHQLQIWKEPNAYHLALKINLHDIL
jgi:hypothetical protein